MMRKRINLITIIAIFAVLLGGGIIRTEIFQSCNYIKHETDEFDTLFFPLKTKSINLFSKISNNETESNGILYYFILNNIINNYDSLYKKIENSDGNILKYSQYLNKSDIYILHLPSYIFSIASLFLVYLTGRKLCGIKTGILAALFFSFNSIELNSVAYCRFYQLNIFLCCLSSLLLINLFTAKNKILAGIIYSLSLCACIASLMCSVFIISFHLLYILINNKNKKLIIYALVPIFLFLLLWRIDPQALNRKADYGNYSLSGYISMEFGLFNQNFRTDTVHHEFEGIKIKIYDLYKGLHIILFILSGVITAKAILGKKIVFNSTLLKNKQLQNSIIFSSLWVFIPFSIMWLITAFYTNIIKPYNLCFIVPGTSLFLGTVLSALPKYLKHIFLIMTLTVIPFPYNSAYEDFTDRAHYIKNNLEMNDIIICDETLIRKCQMLGLPPFVYYNIGSLDTNLIIDAINKDNKLYGSKSIWLCCPEWDRTAAQSLLDYMVKSGYTPLIYCKSNFGYNEYINVYHLQLPNN